MNEKPRWEQIEDKIFHVQQLRSPGGMVTISKVPLKTAKKIHREDIKTINYDSRTVILYPLVVRKDAPSDKASFKKANLTPPDGFLAGFM